MTNGTSEMLSGKRVVVTGGTGSFGQRIVRALLAHSLREIVVFSRDEKKQWDLRQSLSDPRVTFSLGDVRDALRLREVVEGADIVFHAAALKQVPACEFAPHEAVLTNVIGAENLRRAALHAKVPLVVAVSTDKAVKPVNAMGMTKALQEKILLRPRSDGDATRFICVRYGNVLGSRGSVVPLFHRLIRDGQPLGITHPDMTRFQLLLGDAVELVLTAAAHGKHGEVWVRKMPAARVKDIARVLAKQLTGNDGYAIVDMGLRPGEKMHEVLVSEEEMWRAEERDEFFVIRPGYLAGGNPGPTPKVLDEYSSLNAKRLGDDELVEMLAADGWFRGKAVEREVSAFES